MPCQLNLARKWAGRCACMPGCTQQRRRSKNGLNLGRLHMLVVPLPVLLIIGQLGFTL